MKVNIELDCREQMELIDSISARIRVVDRMIGMAITDGGELREMYKEERIYLVRLAEKVSPDFGIRLLRSRKLVAAQEGEDNE